MARKELRQSSADFLKIMVNKISAKEEPATPSFNNQDQQKITEIAKTQLIEFSGHQNRKRDFVVTNKLKEKYSGKKV